MYARQVYLLRLLPDVLLWSAEPAVLSEPPWLAEDPLLPEALPVVLLDAEWLPVVPPWPLLLLWVLLGVLSLDWPLLRLLRLLRHLPNSSENLP